MSDIEVDWSDAKFYNRLADLSASITDSVAGVTAPIVNPQSPPKGHPMQVRHFQPSNFTQIIQDTDYAFTEADLVNMWNDVNRTTERVFIVSMGSWAFVDAEQFSIMLKSLIDMIES